MGDARRGHSGLGRRAAEVDAGATQVLALRQGDAFPSLGQAAGEWDAGLPAANDQHIIVAAHRHGAPRASVGGK
jgi:hypothetical protein